MKTDDALLRDAVIIADIGYYGGGEPHRRTLRRLMARNAYPPDVREGLEYLARMPPGEAAAFVRERLGRVPA